MDRSFTDDELDEIIQLCIDTHTNMLRYLCRENYCCRYSIMRSLAAVVKHDIIPETYWHGSIREFESLLVLLSDGYPGEEALLSLARTETFGEIECIASHFYQRTNVMFSYVQKYAGYDVLQPTAYMTSLYPSAAGKLCVYTEDKWNNRGLSGIDGAFMVICRGQLPELPSLISKKIRGY